MNKRYALPLSFFTLLFMLGMVNRSSATHIYGADLYYTHGVGNNYSVTLVVYGDCSAQPNVFNGLYGATPTIDITNNGVFFASINLQPASPNGIEVTPVCPAQANNTACSTPPGTVPGVRKFVYTANVVLNAASANWNFNFSGKLSSTNSAGRSNTITNINTGSTVTLNATLNNLTSANSSPVYTTIPTPFFCVNKLANYNPGAVDANGDSLSFALVDGYDGASPVTYFPPYTSANPIDVVPGTQVLNINNGQLSFIPRSSQRSLVVYTVSEYRNGVLVGTSQREMTFVVLSNCSSNPPKGTITNPSTTDVTVKDSTSVVACASAGPFTFQINPFSPDGNHVTVTSAGLPAGATFTVTNNGTTAPRGVFSWNTTGVATGTYNFFLTLQDDGCPLSSKQTIAYTINVFGMPTVSVAQLTPASCTKKARIQITPGTTGPWTVKVLQGTTVIQTNNAVNAAFTDSLSPGSYKIRVTNSGNCSVEVPVFIAPPAGMVISSVTVTDALCFNSKDGQISISVTGGTAPYSYQLNSLGSGFNSTIGSLDTGSYIVHVKDANNCTLDTASFYVSQPMPIVPSVSVTNATCHTLSNGSITVTTSGGIPAYTYSANAGSYGVSNVFSSLAGGAYVIHTKDAHNCVKDTTITIKDSLNVSTLFNVTGPKCNGSTDGTIIVNGINGTSPYTYAFGAGAYSTTNSLSNVGAGVYTVHVKDAWGCIADANTTVTQPAIVVAQVTVTPPLCYNGSDGSITVTGTGGTPGYTYSLNNSAYGSNNIFSNLKAGTDSIKLKDANGCLGKAVATIPQPQRLIIDSAITTNALCFGDNSGTVLAAGTGGTTPYTFAINGGAYQSSNFLTGLKAGANTLHVKDNNGCTRDTVLVISQPEPLLVKVDSLNNPTCEGFKDGLISVKAWGGTPPYAYSIIDTSHYSAVRLFTKLGENTYAIYIKDAHKCLVDTTITLTGYPHIIIDGITVSNVSCYGGSDGAITLAAHGGMQPLRYQWGRSLAPVANNSWGNVGAGEYPVVVFDNKNCQKDTTAIVTQPDELHVELKVTPNACIGNEDMGVVQADVKGGTQPYSYLWSTTSNNTDAFIVGLPNGTYSVYVKDSNNCSDSSSSLVTYDNCCTPFLPDAFTPNSDRVNDHFRIRYKGDLKLEYFWIYNRYGQRIFNSNNIDVGWDGTFNGAPQDMDTYFYYIKAICGYKGDHEVVLKGNVTLIR